MSTTVTIDGTDYVIPGRDERDWDDEVTALLQKLAEVAEEGGGGGAELSDDTPADVTTTAGSPGVSEEASRADHKHDVTTAAAVSLTDSTNAEGNATSLARSNHTHAHGSRGGGTLHAEATASLAGFMSAFHRNQAVAQQFVPVDPTVSDFVTATSAALATAASLGINRIHYGDSTWIADHLDLNDDSALIDIPDGMQVTGNGQGRSIISCINVGAIGTYGVVTFRTEVGANNILFQGLHFIGDNGTDENDFTYQLNHQAACIDIAWTGNNRDICVRDCYFAQLWGFSVHDRGDTNERVHVMDCTFFCCSNGVNVNASYSIQTGNVMDYSEGFEASGARVIIANNTMNHIQGSGVSIGGNQTPGAEYPGSVVMGNSIAGGGADSGVGIVVSDGCFGTLIANNNVTQCADGGIDVGGIVTPPAGCIIIGNVVDSNCISGIVGMDIGGDGGHLIHGNICVDRAQAPFDQRTSMSLTAPDCVVQGNYFDGSFKDASFGTGATNTLEDGNFYANANEEWISTSSRATNRTSVKASTDIIQSYRVWNASNVINRGLYQWDAAGKHSWGDGANVQDTHFYRSAAATLTVGDNLAVGQDLTVGDDLLVVDDATIVGDADIIGYLKVNTNKFTVAAASGNTLIAGTLDVTGNFAVNTNKFTVAASTGNTAVAGDLTVDTDTLAVDATNNIIKAGSFPGYTSSATNATQNAMARANLVNNDGANYLSLLVDAYSGGDTNPVGNTLTFRGARGTQASPAEVEADDYLGDISGRGWTTAGNFPITAPVGVFMRAGSQHTGASRETYVEVVTTPSGSTTRAQQLKVHGTGVNVPGTLLVDTDVLGASASSDYVFVGPSPGYTALGSHTGTTNGAAKLHLVNNDVANYQNIWLDAYSGAAGTAPSATGITMRAARGTLSSRTALSADDEMGFLGARGWHSSGAFTTSNKALIFFRAAEAWTNTAQGTYLTFEVTAPTTTTRAESLRIHSTGLTYKGATGITAFAGGGQANATQLASEVNFVSTCATAADSVKLPVAALGMRVVVFNLGANSTNIYPASGGAIDALGTNNPYALAAGASREFWGQSTTQWRSK